MSLSIKAILAAHAGCESLGANTLNNYLGQQKDLLKGKPASSSDIKEAEKELNLKFAPEFVSYLSAYGTATFDSNELMGIGKGKHNSVVEMTKDVRESFSGLGDSFYVILSLGIDGVFILQDSTGKVYQISPNKDPKEIANSILDYFSSNVAGNEELQVPELTPLEQHELAEEVAHAELANEIQENSKEIQKLGDTVEAIDEEVEELEQVVDGMEFLCAQPELNRGAIDILYRRATKLSHNLGGEEVRQVAGNESLATDDAYRAAVVAGCEGFMETMKSAYNATSSFIKNIFYALVDAVKSLFNYSTNLSSKAKTLKKDLKDKEMKSDIKLGGWNRFFEGNITALDKVVSEVGKVIPEFSGMIKDLPEFESVDKEDNQFLLKRVEEVSSKFENAIKNHSEAWNITGGFGKFKTARGTSDKNLIYWAVPERGKYDAENVDKAIGAFSFDIATTNHTNLTHGTTLTGDAKPMFNKSDVDGILNSVIKNAELIKNLKGVVDNLKSTVDGLVNKLKKGPKEGGDKEATKVFISALKRLVSKHSQLVNNFCRIVTNIDSAKLQAVKAHF